MKIICGLIHAIGVYNVHESWFSRTIAAHRSVLSPTTCDVYFLCTEYETSLSYAPQTIEDERVNNILYVQITEQYSVHFQFCKNCMKAECRKKSVHCVVIVGLACSMGRLLNGTLTPQAAVEFSFMCLCERHATTPMRCIEFNMRFLSTKWCINQGPMSLNRIFIHSKFNGKWMYKNGHYLRWIIWQCIAINIYFNLWVWVLAGNYTIDKKTCSAVASINYYRLSLTAKPFLIWNEINGIEVLPSFNSQKCLNIIY